MYISLNYLFESGAKNWKACFIYLFIIVSLWAFCCACCDYRNCKFGHNRVKAFSARTKFQKVLTLLQSSRNISPKNIGKITYIGYVISIIATIEGFIIIPLALILERFFNITILLPISEIGYWGCLLLCLIGFFIQEIDSRL